MKPITTWLAGFGLIALLTLAVGCASPKQTENLLGLAGFKTVIASTAKQQQLLKALPPGKVSQIQRKGKTYYVFPDVARNQAWVGSPKEYRSYQQIRADYKLSNENLADAKLAQADPSDYDDWDGMEVVIWSE
jgi:hypothetical protein